MFRELAVSYLGRNDLAHVDTSDFSNTALGRGINEGRAQAVSKGLTRGAPLKVVSGLPGGEPKGFAGAQPAGTPAKVTAPVAFSGSNVRSISSAAAVQASAPAYSDGATAFKRDFEQHAKEAAEEAKHEEAATELFTEAAAQEAAEAKAKAAERRNRAIMQGYTGNMCTECQNFTMVRNGTCEKCDTCGQTNGCS